MVIVVAIAIAGAAGFLLGSVLSGRDANALAQRAFRAESLGHLARLDSVAEPGQVVFLGSSTFHALDVGSVAAPALNLSLGGDTVDGLLERIAGYRSLPQARAVVLNIGLNDLMRGRVAEDIPVHVLFQAIPPEKPVVVLGVQKVSGTVLERRPGLTEAGSQLDTRFEQACRQRSRCVFVENPADGTAAGNLLLGADGVHLSSDGYARLRGRLRLALVDVGSRSSP